MPLAANWITNEDGKVIKEEIQNVPDKFFMTPMGGNRENSSHKGIKSIIQILKSCTHPCYIIRSYLTVLFIHKGYGLACVIDIMCNTLSGIGAGFLTGGGGLLFQAYDIESFCDKDVMIKL